ncbi:MAG: GTP-binding protein [Candidatus Methanospirare jalkutatii]|nr:GTP-binding protein [Candidatus Methanospirare jalkutatii]
MEEAKVVFVGHVDHGKSTLIGRLLYDSESIHDERVAEIQELVEEFKRRFEFAYFLDALEDEMREERTIDTTALMFKGKNRLYTLTDVPGHKEFIKNMLTGASHADLAVLVVSATEGVKEQTRRHLFLLHLLGVPVIAVVVNKMDAVAYSRERFEEVCSQVKSVLRSLGMSEDVAFIPASAINGENIYRRSENMGWYAGKTLIETLDEVELRKSSEEKFRFVVQDVYEVASSQVIVGRVASGRMSVAEEVVFEPSHIRARISKILTADGELNAAEKGDSVGIVLQAVGGADTEAETEADTEAETRAEAGAETGTETGTGGEAGGEAGGGVRRGDVCGYAHEPPIAVSGFLGEAVLLEPLKKGEVLNLRVCTASVEAKVLEIRERIDSESGEMLEQFPEEIEAGDAAVILFETEPVVVERFSEIPPLGRFALVRNGKNIGAGVVLEIFGEEARKSNI